MSDPTHTTTEPVEDALGPSEVIEPDVIAGPEAGSPPTEQPAITESVEQPAKVMRLGAMLRQLLEELRESDLDVESRDRMREIYETSVLELGSGLSPDLRDELARLALPFGEDETPTEAELRVAQAQLVGWLEGLVQGIQATLFAQQMAAQQQLANMRGQLPAGARPGPQGIPPQGGAPPQPESRPGTYL